jgi:hypothetical protein
MVLTAKRGGGGGLEVPIKTHVKLSTSSGPSLARFGVQAATDASTGLLLVQATRYSIDTDRKRHTFPAVSE